MKKKYLPQRLEDGSGQARSLAKQTLASKDETSWQQSV